MKTATSPRIAHGNFNGLASNYAKFRPGYTEDALSALIGIAGKASSQMDVADVGAGTGIWTRIMANRGFKSMTAVEPNADMRGEGEAGNEGLKISWKEGSAEVTGLPSASFDIVTMASSFHWPDFDKATAEFHRILKPGGVFAALWNPRYIKDNQLLVDIEKKSYEIAPNISRVSSGSSAFVETLTARFADHKLFATPTYIEGRHTARLSREHYIGVWESVNDIRSQMGEVAWGQYMQYIKDVTKDLTHIDCSYLTRMWVMRRKD
jgi:ubiquinone/menaquinone biosynthesis C-methylase UbiE